MNKECERALANAQEERILNERRRFKNLPFDIQPIPAAQLEDLSQVIFETEYLPQAFAPDVLEANQRSYVERLSSCRMIVSVDNPTPTLMGLLAIGKNPRSYVPGAYVQFLRIDGTELADPVVDHEDIGGNIAEILRRTEEKLKAHNRIAVDIVSAPVHQMKAAYPLVALQQILYNAVLHRSYENTNTPIRVYWFNDRIEINSPGGPYGNVTTANFAQPGVTDYRNPSLADVLKTFGYVQAFGRGIATAQRAMVQNGNPPLEFDINQTRVLCVLRGKPSESTY